MNAMIEVVTAATNSTYQEIIIPELDLLCCHSIIGARLDIVQLIPQKIVNFTKRIGVLNILIYIIEFYLNNIRSRTTGDVR